MLAYTYIRKTKCTHYNLQTILHELTTFILIKTIRQNISKCEIVIYKLLDHTTATIEYTTQATTKWEVGKSFEVFFF